MSDGLWPLPQGWRWRKAAEIAQIIGGGTPTTSDESNFDDCGIPWITPADLTGYEDTYITRGRRCLSEKGLVACGARVLPTGAVLYSSRAPIGYCAIASNPISTNQGFKSLVLNDGSVPEYVRYYFLASKEYAEGLASGTTFKELSGSRMAELLIPVAPPEEQRRIVAKLDRLFARSKSAREELARIPRLVERHKQAVLGAAYSDAEIGATGITTLGEVAEELRNGVSRRPENTPPGVAVLKISAVRSMAVRIDERRYYVLEAREDVSRYALRAGDLLFTRYNGNPDLVANCGMVRVLAEQLIYPDKLIRVRIDRELADPEFIEAVCSSPQARSALAPSIKSAAGQHGISGADLKRLPLPLPSRARQQRIISRIRRSFSAIDAMVAESSHAASILNRLDQAILAKAFRGELLPKATSDAAMA